MSRRWVGAWLALAAGLAVLGAAALGQGDPVAADALWLHAEQASGGELTAPLFLDAAREASRVRPWQPGFAEARARLRRVEQARLAAISRRN